MFTVAEDYCFLNFTLRGDFVSMVTVAEDYYFLNFALRGDLLLLGYFSFSVDFFGEANFIFKTLGVSYS